MRQKKYFESELVFSPASVQEPVTENSKGLFSEPPFAVPGPAQILGINVRIGNKPLVYDLKVLAGKGRKRSALRLDKHRDHYLVVHTIGALRTSGKSTLNELQYFAEALHGSLQTIDLIPATHFKTRLSSGLQLEGSLSVNGETSLDIPTELLQSLLPKVIPIGANMQLQLSASADFAGKFSFRIQSPVVQSMGIGSSFCSWVLNPDEHRQQLLGDQLLIQSISVPKGTKEIIYKVSALARVYKGILQSFEEKRTPEFKLHVTLKP